MDVKEVIEGKEKILTKLNETEIDPCSYNLFPFLEGAEEHRIDFRLVIDNLNSIGKHVFWVEYSALEKRILNEKDLEKVIEISIKIQKKIQKIIELEKERMKIE